MKIKSIKLGYYSFGPSSGQKTLQIHLENGECENLYEAFKTEIEQKGLQTEFYEAINGTQTTFFSFVGGVIEQTENTKEWEDFITQLSKESLDLQKEPEALKTNMGNLRPPFMIFIGKPRVMTGIRDFYQNFNVVIALIDSQTDHSELALQEMMNHQYSVIVQRAVKPGDIVKSRFPSRKISIYAIQENGADSEVEEKALKYGYRFYSETEGSLKLDNVWTSISD